jgi:hypothetical protein
MLSKPTVAQLRSAAHLGSQSFWKDFESMIDGELVAILNLMVDSRDLAVLHQLQGRARALKELRQVVVESPALLEKVERPSGGTRGF